MAYCSPHEIQAEYPNGEALRVVAEKRLQRVIFEFEFESRNFLRHHHDPSKCDLIVCWEHNWPECPLVVLGLKKVNSNQQTAISQNLQPQRTQRSTGEKQNLTTDKK